MSKIYLQDNGNDGVYLHTETKSVHVKLFHGYRALSYFEMDSSTADIINLDKEKYIDFSNFIGGDSPVEASLIIPEAGINSKFFQMNDLVKDIKKNELTKVEGMTIDEKRKEIIFSYLKDVYFKRYNKHITGEDLNIRKKLFNNDETLFEDLYKQDIKLNSYTGSFRLRLEDSIFNEADSNFGKYIINNLKECAEKALTSELHYTNIFERAILREFNLTDAYIDKLDCGFVDTSEIVPKINMYEPNELNGKLNPLTDMVFINKSGFYIIETDEGSVATDGEKFILAKGSFIMGGKFKENNFNQEVIILKEGDNLIIDDLEYSADKAGLNNLQIIYHNDKGNRLQKNLIVGSLERESLDNFECNKPKKQNKLKP